ncbi:flagellar filament capping protein FliD [Limnohabitans sp.]|uniref:flagellar filament capping protein FliD n=1 Tax=Limnohabitans sp. TaxID=1907725 RepID=UPI00333FD8D6
MATSSIVNTLGAGSGIDVKALAQSLVDAEKTPKKERIDEKIAKSEARISGYGFVKSELLALQQAFSMLNDASDFSSIQPSNTQPAAFGITASSTAEAGNYSIEVLQTALAQRTASITFAGENTTLNEGAPFNLNLTVGNSPLFPIAVKTTTPAGIVSAINGAKQGVTAQLINTGSVHQIVLTGETGAAKNFSMSTAPNMLTNVKVPTNNNHEVRISDAPSATSVTLSFKRSGTQEIVELQKVDDIWKLPPNTSLEGVTDLNAEATVPVFYQPLQTATDASFKVNGLTVTRSSNTVNDVIKGVTLDLFTNTTGAARLDLNRNTAGIKDNIKGLVTAYNDFEKTLKILGDRANEVEEFGGILAGESLLQSVRSQVRAMITSTSTTPGTTIKAARDVGLSIDRFGKLTLDEAKLDTALQNHFGEVSTMFSGGTNNQSIYNPSPRGLAPGAVNSIEKMLLSTGLIETQSKNATTQISKYKEELTALNERMEKLMARYMSQFSVMESIVGNSNSMREGLKGTFEGMMKAYGN